MPDGVRAAREPDQDDLVTTEGVDEGSSRPEPEAALDVLDPTEPTGSELEDDQLTPPTPPETTPTAGPGQQLAEGEG